MIDFTSARPFRRDDLAAVLQCLGECNVQADFCCLLHPADFIHHLSNGLRGGDPSNSVFVLEDEASHTRSLIILSINKEIGYYDLVIHPADRSSESLHDGIVWCEQAVQTFAAQRGTVLTAWNAPVLSCDELLINLLPALGYTPASDIHMVHNFQILPDSVPESVLPEGFMLRNVESEAEADALGAAHSGAFGSNWPPGEYLKVMQTPGFQLNQELIVVAPDGRYVAFVIHWIDPVTRCGLFEPVGCHKGFQRRGLTKALMYEGMRRMIAQGMTRAIVNTNADNVAALALYHSVGFQQRFTIKDYRKFNE